MKAANGGVEPRGGPREHYPNDREIPQARRTAKTRLIAASAPHDVSPLPFTFKPASALCCEMRLELTICAYSVLPVVVAAAVRFSSTSEINVRNA
jgi:hypothetical protein